MSENNAISTKNFFVKLLIGDFGLVKTFWLYYVGIGLGAGFLALVILKGNVLSSHWGIWIVIGWTVYKIIVLIGIWRAATKYQGNKVWDILAKIMVGLGFIGIAKNLSLFI